jgi:acetyl esterase/lipase
MRPAMTAMLLMAFAATTAFAAEPTVIKLWPGKAPGETGNIGPEEAKTKPGEKPPITRVGNVSEPTLTVYRPAKVKDDGKKRAIFERAKSAYEAELEIDKEAEKRLEIELRLGRFSPEIDLNTAKANLARAKANTIAKRNEMEAAREELDPSAPSDSVVIVAPGGGYNILAWEHEGTQVAEWLNKIGVTAVVLKYRVPRRPDQPKDAPPIGALQDAQRAVSLVRSNAKEWGLNPEHVGFLGFSAGGHLTAWVSTNFDKRSYETVDAADKLSCRPDFAVLIYPGGVLVKNHPEQLTPELRVSKETPPSFLAHAADDHPESSITYFQELRKNGVQAEMHIYGAGGHGFGMHRTGNPAASWTDRCADWMKKQGYVQ